MTTRPLAIRPGLLVEALEGRVLLSHGPTDHIHPKLSIVIEGQPVTIPANLGIAANRHYSPHTHDTTGQLHVGEAPIAGIDPQNAPPRLTTLKDVFDVWRTTNVGQPSNNPNAVFSRTQILDRRTGPTGVVRMTVNGQPNTQFENYSPHDQDQIVISFERITPPPPTPPPPTPPTPPPPTPPPPPSATPEQRAFVAQVYRDVLKREADAPGLDAWAGRLAQGTSNTDVTLSIQNSGEGQTAFVREAYQGMLGRAATADEINSALGAFTVGGTREQIMAALMATDDYFQQRGGYSNESFLDALYREHLGRAPDAAGRAGFLQALTNGSTRRQVAEVIFGSAEYREKLAQSYYQQFLGRVADPSGVNYWANVALRAGARDEQVITGFLTSEEYRNRRR